MVSTKMPNVPKNMTTRFAVGLELSLFNVITTPEISSYLKSENTCEYLMSVILFHTVWVGYSLAVSQRYVGSDYFLRSIVISTYLGYLGTLGPTYYNSTLPTYVLKGRY